MDSLINTFKSICIGPGPEQNNITLTISSIGKTSSFNSALNQDIMKLYYTLLQYVDKVKQTNDYPTKVEIVGDNNKTYYFTTYKKIF